MRRYDFFRLRSIARRLAMLQAGYIRIPLPLPAGVEYFVDGQWRMVNVANQWWVYRERTPSGKPKASGRRGYPRLNAASVARWGQP